jgi:hypothetical protein
MVLGINLIFNKGCCQTPDPVQHPLCLKRRFVCFIVVFLSHINNVFGQIQVQGMIVDMNNKPVKYVDIGIERKGLGTVSDANGVFSLVVPDSLKDESLTFSHFSYYTRHISISEIKRNQAISLEERVVDLPEVSVNPQKISFKRLKKGIKMLGDMQITGLGGSTGVVLNIRKESLLKHVEFEVKSCSYDSVIIRLDINKIQSESLSLGDTYLSNHVYETVRKSYKSKTCKINMTDDTLLKKGTIYIFLECVAYHGKGEIHFSMNTKAGYIKETPMALLEKYKCPFIWDSLLEYG